VCQAIRGVVQFLIRQRPIANFDGETVRESSHNLLKSLRDRRLDILFWKVNKRSRRMKAFIPNRLLLRGKFKVLFERIAHVFLVL
jgi:hypothetical protein